MKVKSSALLHPSPIGGCEGTAGAAVARLLCSALLIALPELLGLPTLAAAFDCGSTGACGPMNITNNTTLDSPPDGIFNCTTITVAAGNTLTFNRNALNTPVYLLATGDVTVNGTIDVSASGRSGGPGGFDGGRGGSVLEGLGSGGDGMGPGGGTVVNNWRHGAFGTPSLVNSNPRTYGNLLLCPLIGGSGSIGLSGNPGVDGCGGGGAILIASNTRIAISGSGAIRSGGATDGVGLGGSGGAIRLVSPLISGNGSLSVLGGANGTWGGFGRIRIDCLDNYSWRSLNLSRVVSRGQQMHVFPAAQSRLDIIAVAGNAIPEGTNNAVQFELSAGASTNQTVTVQARNFTNDVPIQVVVTPDNGPSGSFDAVILQASGNPPSTTVNVVIPTGMACQINAWTR
jgi:hypothetical protein